MDKKTQSTATVIFTDNPPFNQEGEVEKKDAKPEADSLYGGNPAVMADAIEQMKNVRKLLKDRLKGVKDNAEAFIEINATEKVRLQGSKETKAPELKPYTEAVDVKNRAELSQLVEKAKKEKKLFKIGRSMKEGFRYTFLVEDMVKEEAKPEFKVGSTIKIISMAGEPEYTGKVGKITKIDDAGQLHGTWGGLALIPGDDKFELVTVINHETGSIEEKKEVEEAFFFDGKEFGTKLTSFEQAKELGKGAKWPVAADKKYFDMYHDKGFELFVKGTGKDRVITIVRNGDVVNAYDVDDKLVVLEQVIPTMKAMPKMEAAPEEHHHDEEHKDEGEYDEEGDMAKSDLQIMADAALELHGLLADEENLPEWVQAKITLATDYIDTARDYMKAKKDGKDFPEPKEEDEVELEPLEEAAPGSWGKEVITLQEFATALEKLGRDDIDVFPILSGIAAGTHRAFVKHEGKDTTITVLRGDVVEMTLTSGAKKESVYVKEEMEIKETKFFPGEDGDTEANMFIEEHGIEDFGLTWDDAKGGYMLTWVEESELLESRKPTVKFDGNWEFTKALTKEEADALLSFVTKELEVRKQDIKTQTFESEKGDITYLIVPIYTLSDEQSDMFRDFTSKQGLQGQYGHDSEWFVVPSNYMLESKLHESKEEKKELKEDTTILSNLNEFSPWSGAVSTWELIVEADKVEALDFMLEDLYPEGITSTELNDLLWFESSWVLDMLSIDENKLEVEEDEELEGEEPKAEAKPERELIALDDLDEEPVVFDIDELEESKHAHDKKEKHDEKEEVEEDVKSNIVKDVQDFISKTMKQ